MAQYIITIDDHDNGVMIKLAGPPAQGPANHLAKSLVTMAPHLLRILMTHGFTAPDCKCERCLSMHSTEPATKPTLH